MTGRGAEQGEKGLACRQLAMNHAGRLRLHPLYAVYREAALAAVLSRCAYATVSRHARLR